MLHPYEMDPMDSQNLSEWNFARANQDKYMIIQDGTQKEGQFLMEGTHNFTENMNVISYMSHGSSGGGCISGGSEVVGPFVKCANEISYGGSGGAVRSFTKYGFLVQYGNGMNVWRWMGGSATTTRARAEPKALRKKKKRKCRGQFETETAATARHEHQKIKNRAAAAQSFQQKQAYEVQLHTHIQKLRKENEFHKKLLTFLKTHNSKNHEKLRKEKQIPIEENDDDYRPSEAEDGSDTESYDSFEHEEQSKGNIANRERMYTKHRCGSRSIPIRVEKLIGLGWHFLRATMM